VAAAATAVNYVSLLGAASRRMDNSDSVSDLTLAASVGVFEQGKAFAKFVRTCGKIRI
jgi:hypothetical protein